MATAPKAVQKAPAKGAPEAEPQAPAAAKKSSKKLFLIVAVLAILIGGGGAAWYFTSQGAGDKPKAHPKEPAKPPVFLVIEPFTVNLQPEDAGDQYLQVAFSLQVADEKEVDTVKLYLPQVRSRLLLLLSGKKASEISTVEGKKKLADEIIKQVNQPLTPGEPPLHIKNVFFTSFVIQ